MRLLAIVISIYLSSLHKHCHMELAGVCVNIQRPQPSIVINTQGLIICETVLPGINAEKSMLRNQH